MGQEYGSGIVNARIPQLSKWQWIVLALVALLLIYFVFAGVIGGHG